MAAERVKVKRVGRGGSVPGGGGPRGGGPGGDSRGGCAAVLVRWLVSALIIYLVAWLLGSHVRLDGPTTALFVAAVLGLLNTVVRPLMILLTMPITIFTLGLFLFVINALMVMLAAGLSPGFAVDHFGWALLAAVLISIMHLVVNAFVGGLTGGGK